MRRILFILFFISGALSLVYEVVWLRLLILVFGSTHFAVTAVLTAFMAGLALGSLLLGRYSDRSGKHPLAIYGLLEIGIGLFAVLTPLLLGSLEPLAALIGRGSGGSYYVASAARFLCVMAVLILPTAMMGGTLPVLSRLAARNTGEIGWSVGALYGANTLGAVAGTALAGFVMMPQVGARATLILAALGNILIGLIALEMVRRWWLAGEPVPRPLQRSPLAATAPGRSAVLLLLIAGSGFIALVYEVAWTRVLSLVLGSSVYAFTCMLATFLAGLALGAGIGARIADRLSRRRAFEFLAGALAAAALAGYATFRQLPSLPLAFANAFHGLGLASPEAGTSWGRALRLIGIEFLIAFAVMLPATIFMGMVFPLVIRLWAGSTEALGTSVGRVYAANTGGTILGSALSGFVILPVLGLRGGLLFAVAGGLALAAGAVWIIPGWKSVWKGLAAASAVAGAAILALSGPAWDPFVTNSGVFQYVDELEPSDLTVEGFSRAFHRNQELLYYEEGLISTVVVSRESSSGNVWLAVNGKIDAASSGPDLATQLLLGHLPMLHLPDRDAGDPGPSVLVIGYASGITTGAVTRHDPARVIAAEIEPAVLRGSVHFDAFNHRPLEDSRVTVAEEDGRNFLLVSNELYDVIISEPSNPWMTVAANLFTREFFEIGKRRLSPGGIFCQWVPIYGLPPHLLKAIVRTFAAVFPHARVYEPGESTDIILLGSDRPLPVRLDTMGRRLAGAEVGEDLERIQLRTVQDLLTYHLMGDVEARAFAGEGPLNTDDNAMIEFAAPLTLHAATRQENREDLRSHVDDPLVGARGLPAPPEERAALYTSLGEAFYSRGMTRRAFGALSRAQEIHPTPEQAALLSAYRRQVPGEAGR
jgi:spermidine synthase